MRRKNQFDEVMIVNPSEGSANSNQRVRLMRFQNVFPPQMAGYAEPDAYGYYAEPETYGYYGQPQPYGYVAESPYPSAAQNVGYYAEAEPAYGYYGQVDPSLSYYSEADPAYGYYGEADPPLGYYGGAHPAYGYYGEVEPAVGYYGQADPAYGYYAQTPEFAGPGYSGGPVGYAEPEPVGYFAEETPMAYYGEDAMPMGYYGQPEMVGYGEAEQQFAEEYPGVGVYGEPEFGESEFAGYDGYTRDMPPAFNPGCPLPTNLSGYEGFEGYTSPATVNPSCDTMTSQPGTAPSTPDTFKPLW
jgi:hypothetical protein